MLFDAGSWKQNDIVDALAVKFRVACVDALGHGRSDKPSDPRLYGQDQRSSDIVGVIDDLGCERAHLVGHSMGGWLAVGVAKRHPRRLSSLVVGGWDLMNGLPPGPKGPVSFDAFKKFAIRTAAALAGWVIPEFEPGVRACFEALSQFDGGREAVLTAGAPVMLWNGRDETGHAPMQAFAAAEGLAFLSTAGDHVGAYMSQNGEGAKGIRAFLDGV